MAVRSVSQVLIGLVSVVFLTSCSWIKEQNGGENPMGLSTLGMASATGAVIGGGLGAIVGSTTGSAGGGLVIGSLAGAAAGAAIGKGLENQEKDVEEVKLRSERQQELLKANRARINQIKKGSDIPNRSSSVEGRGRLGNVSKVVNTPPGYRGNPKAVRYGGTNDEPIRARSVVASSVKTQTQPVVETKKVVEAKVEQPRETIAKNEVDLIPQEKPVAPVAKSEGLPPPKLTTEDAPQAPKEEVVLDKVEAPSPVEPEVTKVAPVVAEVAEPATITSTKVEPAKVEQRAGDDCGKAEQEFARAKSSVSDADKLFYLRRALRLCAGKPNYHVAVGRIYTRLGRTADAEYEFRQALDLEPANSEAKSEISKLTTSAN